MFLKDGSNCSLETLKYILVLELICFVKNRFSTNIKNSQKDLSLSH